MKHNDQTDLDHAVVEEMLRHPRELEAAFAIMQKADRPTSGGGLTARQTELLAFIVEYHRQHSMTPLYSEMMEAMGLVSKSGVHRLVKALISRGRISHLPNRERSITILNPR